MDILRLRYFERVARMRSFSRAAEELHVAQPALSKQIAALERELGARVFERTGRELVVTQTGHLLLRHTDRLLENFSQLWADMGDFVRTSRTELRLGATTTVAKYLFPSALCEFVRRNPQVDVLIDVKTAAELSRDIVEGRLNAAACILSVHDPRISEELLLEDDFVLSVPRSHPWAERNAIEFAELRGVPLILPRVDLWYRDIVAPACRQQGFWLTPRVETSSYEIIQELVVNGVGVALVPRVAADKGGVVVPLVNPELRRAIHWITRRGAAPNRSLEAFQALVRCAAMPS